MGRAGVRNALAQIEEAASGGGSQQQVVLLSNDLYAGLIEANLVIEAGKVERADPLPGE